MVSATMPAREEPLFEFDVTGNINRRQYFALDCWQNLDLRRS